MTEPITHQEAFQVYSALVRTSEAISYTLGKIAERSFRNTAGPGDAVKMRAASDMLSHMYGDGYRESAEILRREADQIDPPVTEEPAKPDLTTRDGWFAELDRANSGSPTGWPGMTAPGTAAELKALRRAWLWAVSEANSDAQLQLACLYTLYGQDQFEDF